MKWTIIISQCLLVGLCCSLLWFFILIAIYQQVYIQEPNKLVLSLEIAATLLTAGLGLYNLWKISRGGRT